MQIPVIEDSRIPKPLKPSRKRPAGWKFHKNPLCPCTPCKRSRERQTEAYLGPAGTRRAPVDAEAEETDSINADLPAIILQRNSARDRVAQWVAYRIQEPGITTAEIARRQDISVSCMNGILAKARKEGWLKFADPLSELEYGVVPKVIENINHFLDQKDRVVTIETAKGTLFPAYKAAKGLGDTQIQTVLSIKFEALDSPPKIIEGNVIGKPRGFIESYAVPELGVSKDA